MKDCKHFYPELPRTLHMYAQDLNLPFELCTPLLHFLRKAGHFDIRDNLFSIWHFSLNSFQL